MHDTRRGGCRFGPAYSMLELMVTMTIASALLAAGGPSFVSWVRDERLTTQINLLLADMHLARLEAIKRNQDVVICRSDDGRRCSRSSRSRADWSKGRIVYANSDADKTRDAGEPLLAARAGLRRGMSLRFNQWWRIIYHGDGSAKNGTFTLCDVRGPTHARALILYYTGRPRIADARADGGPLDCP